MAIEATIQGWLETLAADMKSSEMSDSDWAERMAEIIYDASTGRATTVKTPDTYTGTGTVDA